MICVVCVVSVNVVSVVSGRCGQRGQSSVISMVSGRSCHKKPYQLHTKAPVKASGNCHAVLVVTVVWAGSSSKVKDSDTCFHHCLLSRTAQIHVAIKSPVQSLMPSVQSGHSGQRERNGTSIRRVVTRLFLFSELFDLFIFSRAASHLFRFCSTFAFVRLLLCVPVGASRSASRSPIIRQRSTPTIHGPIYNFGKRGYAQIFGY